MRYIIIVLGWIALCFGQETVEISVKGISDDKKDGAQKDRKEAILDARRQACEKAGLSIQSRTTVENFQTTFDLVETRSEAVLLPGYQIIDIGYVADGTYNVVLIGKIKPSSAVPREFSDFHLIVWLPEKKGEGMTRERLLDQLYDWFTSIRGVFDINAKPLDACEDYLREILARDSLSDMERRYFSFVYRFPAGNLLYSRPSEGGSGDDFKLKLRPGLSYAMTVAHGNAIYFDRPSQFSGALSGKRDFGTYPKGFTSFFKRK